MKRKRSVWEDTLLYIVAFVVLLTYSYNGKNLSDGRIVPFLIGCGIALTAAIDWCFIIQKMFYKKDVDSPEKIRVAEYIRLIAGVLFIISFIYNICI